MKTFGSLCSGGGGTDIGAKASGLELAWANEYDPAIAEVYAANLGNHIVVENMLNLNPFDFEWVNHLHMSPPCTRASTANQSAEVNEDGLKESSLDIALSNKCIQFIETLQPESITLENVWAYRKFQSWKGGKKCEGMQQVLYRLGYWLSVEHVNFADLGVPQTRRRMIVRAVRGGMVPYLPQAERWVGWYEAIENIIDTLPDSQFADWQLARLPEELKNDFLFMTEHHKHSEQGREGRGGIIPATCPANTVVTGSHGGARAFLVGKNADKYGDGLRWASEPAQTIGANEHGSKAFVVDCQNAGDPSPDRQRGLTIRAGGDPMFTLTSSMGVKRPTRAYDGVGRVVAMTPRALARFQSFPDAYMLPESKTLAAKIIGNAVPPLGFQKIIGGLL